ncbi:MAG: carbohydrate kinase family protein, partial [Chloroflexi bacterium]|nr:carbohydrate kinase family protein [Chloroflexota bacterium]
MNIIVSGSLAYDRIMNFPGKFSDHILPGKIHTLNISFTVSGIKEKFGGTAGNIAYALELMGKKPTIVATIGSDYQKYFDWLNLNKISTEHIKIIPDDLTACAYITTDQSDNQITGFNPGAMKYPSKFDLSKFSSVNCIMIISPGNMEDMKVYSDVCRRRGIPFIFDPGQSLPMWDGKELTQCIDGSSILISNDYELDLISHKTGLNKKALLKMTGTLITTLGDKGARICTQKNEINIPCTKAKKVIDPTGAGDAFRGGLIC